MSRGRRWLFAFATALVPIAVIALGVGVVLPWAVPVSALRYHFWGNRPTSFVPFVPQLAVNVDYATEFRANSIGFNDLEHALAKPPGRLRVLLLGDSVVEGVQVRPEEHMARGLEALARADGRDVEAIVMAISGQGQSHQLANYEALGRRFDPDLVVSFFSANDIWNNLELEAANGGRPIYVLGERGELVSTLAGRPEIPPDPEELRSHSRKRALAGFRALRRLLKGALAATDRDARRAARAASLYELPADTAEVQGGPPGVAADQRVMFEKLVAGLAGAVVRRDGHRLLAVVASGNLREEPGGRYRRMIGWVTDRFAREGVATLDMEQLLRERVHREGRYPSWERDAHWNALGHAWVAEHLHAALDPKVGR